MWEGGKIPDAILEFRCLLTLYGVTGYQILFGDNPVSLTTAEAKELSRISRTASPALQAKVDTILAILGRAGAVEEM